MKRMQSGLSLGVLLILIVLTACSAEDPNVKPKGGIRGELVVDGTTRTFIYANAISVEEMLRRENVTLGEIDRVNPSKFTQITDGMTVTIVRVREEIECKDNVLSFDERQIPSINIDPGQQQIGQQGENGVERVCERVVFDDNVERSRAIQNRTVVEEPKEQIVFVGVSDTLDLVPIEGTLAYISNGQAWVMQNSNSSRRPLTLDTGLDGRVFELSADGRMLLFTKATDDPEDPDFSNELWVIPNIFDPNPRFLQQIDILTAAWQPQQENMVAYSSATAGGGFQGWTAFNDLWLMKINPPTGEIVDINSVIDPNVSGSYAAWGTRFMWSPDGNTLAYSKSDGVGLVNLDEGEFGPFRLSFANFGAAVASNWVWQPDISWSPDGRWVVTTVHGSPFGAESPVDSVVFNVAIFEVNPDNENELTINTFIKQAGFWATPKFSPETADGTFKIAYLQARSPLNSVGTEYDLIVRDRDGSNPTRLFPPEGQPGIRPGSGFNGQFVWSPSGTKIAIIYQGNLWVVDTLSGVAQQATNDGQAESPRWAN